MTPTPTISPLQLLAEQQRGEAYGRAEVVGYLRALADRPEGIEHRAWLFHAAHLLNRDAEIVWIDRRPRACTCGRIIETA